MRFFLRRSGILVLAALLAAPAASATTNSDAKILLHLTASTLKNPCTSSEAGPPCSNAVTWGDLYPHTYYAYVLVGNVDPVAGVAGLEFGIEYNGAIHAGVDILSWVMCATLEMTMRDWPASGTGNTIIWDATSHCQRPGSNSAIAGFFYLTTYSPDDLRIVPRQSDGYARVSDCQNIETTLVGPGVTPPVDPLGRASFSAGGGSAGYNPCGGGGASPSCSISGPDFVSSSGGLQTYSVAVSDPLAAPSWEITGNGSLVGGTGGTAVQVEPGQPGSFTLTVVVTGSSGSGTCTRTVTVTGGCLIAGPSSVERGQSADFTVSADVPPPVTYHWTVSGAGILNSNSGDSVHVTTGTTGDDFTLYVTYSNPQGANGSCSRSVTITPPFQCVVTGPGALTENTTGIYLVPGLPAGATVAWSVFGSGSIVGPANGPTVTVMGTTPGSFTVEAVVTTLTNTSRCHAGVTVSVTGPQPSLNQNARILVHLATPTTSGACPPSIAQPACSSVKTNGTLFPDKYFAYVLVTNGFTNRTANSGIAGVQFGIRYDGAAHSGVDILSWTSCATLEFPQSDWPASNSGNLVTWDPTNGCQNTEPGGAHTGVVATVGYFYLTAYSEDRLRITPRPVDGYAKVASCEAVETVLDSDTNPVVPSPLGDAYFSATGTRLGYCPCSATVPVIPTTWSQIKTMYGR